MQKRMRAAVLVVAVVSLMGLAPRAAGTSAQMGGAAFLAFSQGDPFQGFAGPFRVIPVSEGGGVGFRFTVLCYTPRTDFPDFARGATANVPEPVTLTAIRDAAVDAAIAVCAEDGVTVARTAVILPAVTLGQ